MIPQHYDPTPYTDALEHGYDRMTQRLVAVEAFLETLREESEQRQWVDILKDSDMIKEWKVGNTVWESPIGD